VDFRGGCCLVLAPKTIPPAKSDAFVFHLKRLIVNQTSTADNSTTSSLKFKSIDRSSQIIDAINMAGPDASQEAMATPEPIEKGFATLNTLK
jgi:hypothetical protein